MSYTLSQVEKFALSESRRLFTTFAVREALGIAKGEYFDSSQACGTLAAWLTMGNHQQRTWAEVCLDGSTLSEFQLYCRIEVQRQTIRNYERQSAEKRHPGTLAVLRADFKSFLKEIQW